MRGLCCQGLKELIVEYCQGVDRYFERLLNWLGLLESSGHLGQAEDDVGEAVLLSSR